MTSLAHLRSNWSHADGTLTVRGADAKTVGTLAASHGVVLYQLLSEQSSLETAFMELTGTAPTTARCPADRRSVRGAR